MGARPAIVRLASTPSTMDALHALAEAGAPSGTAVVAEVQESGRGSRGRPWVSPPGGLWLSMLARPAATALEVLSLRAGLAVADALDTLGAGGRIAIKWPNDLMLDESKCGGILCEARWHGAAPAWVVIGLGLNVTNAPPPTVEPAGRLADVLPALTPDALVEPMVAALRHVDAAAGLLDADERDRFARRDWLRDRMLAAPAAGTALGLAADGGLRVRRLDGLTATVRSGTVVLAETSAPAESRPCS
jgi:BirA family transcriptional regulator, biotin operon repressor / biotin---[acetyl-CoA-carboxylase] ligase